jgi:periplasmic divalent cation tolerance protein
METPHRHPILSVVTTVSSMEQAQLLARTIVDERLAACVQVEPGLVSHYRWQGRHCEDSELRLTIKTLPELADALRALLREHHPYELPQVLGTVMEASAEYAQWVRGEVTPPDAA